MVRDLHLHSSSCALFVSTSTMRPDVKTKELHDEVRRYVALTSSSTSRNDLGFVAAPAPGSTKDVLRVEVNWKVLSRRTEILQDREAERRKAEG